MRFRVALVLTMAGVIATASPAGVLAWAQGDTATPEATTPGEIVLGDQRYAFDRAVPVDLSQMEQRTDDAGVTVWVKPGEDPLDAVYAPGDVGAERYLPEQLGAPDAACPSDAAAAAGVIQGGDVTYIPAAPEPDLTPDDLVQVGQASDGRTIYAPSTDQPFPELFVSDASGGLVHYLGIQPDGVPATFPDRLWFAGQEFELTREAAGTTGDMRRVGCALAFPALAAVDEGDGSYTALAIQVGDRSVVYRASGPVPTVAAPVTEIPTEVPTAMPTIAPTAIPTESPTTAPTLAPTEAPTATLPVAPTIMPTTAPTTAPTAIPTTVPTSMPTTAPTVAPTMAPTMAPTAMPTTAPTTEPTATSTPRPTPTPKPLQPQAVVPTLPPSAPPPAAATSPAVGCAGTAGPVGADGLPERLPPALQYQGSGYRFAEVVDIGEIGDLDRVGCVGAFAVFVDTASGALYLTLGAVADSAWRYERTSSFEVKVEVTADPRVLVLQGQGDQPEVRYRAGEPMVRSIYSSVTLILFVADAEQRQPERILGFAEDQDLFGEYRPEADAAPAPPDVQARAEQHGIHPTLTIGGGPQVYVLVALWEPFGATTNGWLTLYAPTGEATPAQIVGVDPRKLDLSVFNRQGS